MGELQALTLRQSTSEINKLHLEILKLRQNVEETAMQKAIRIGMLLEEQKKKLDAEGYGKWSQWVKDNLEFNRSTAHQYIVISQKHRAGCLPGKQVSIREAARRKERIVEIDATVEPPSSNGDEPERPLNLGIPAEQRQPDEPEKPETVLRQILSAWFEHRRLMLENLQEARSYIHVGKFSGKVLRHEIAACCLKNDEARQELEELLIGKND